MTAPDWTVEEFLGDRATLRPLFEAAEDSATALDGYIEQGRVLVAKRGQVVLGHVQVVESGNGDAEIKNMAVDDAERGHGVGRALVDAAVALVGGVAGRVVVATASADVGNLRFYQRVGFRMLRVERDAFSAERGYADVVIE